MLDKLPKGDTGLYPIFISPKSGRWTNDKKVTLGALGDSFYEYLLKLWLLTGKVCFVDCEPEYNNNSFILSENTTISTNVRWSNRQSCRAYVAEDNTFRYEKLAIFESIKLKESVKGFMFLAELKSNDLPVKPLKRMDHLVCFAGNDFAQIASFMIGDEITSTNQAGCLL